jgi:hypothetical protein
VAATPGRLRGSCAADRRRAAPHRRFVSPTSGRSGTRAPQQMPAVSRCVAHTEAVGSAAAAQSWPLRHRFEWCVQQGHAVFLACCGC